MSNESTPPSFPMGRMLSMKETVRKTSFHRATIYRKEAAGEFPKRRRLSRGRVGYLESEVDAFLASCPPADEAAKH